ncbi:hypothetical protein SK128_022684, partial [Halocaridina rubra]
MGTSLVRGPSNAEIRGRRQAIARFLHPLFRESCYHSPTHQSSDGSSSDGKEKGKITY